MVDTERTTIGERIKVVMDAQKVSQNELERRTGIDRGHISRIINGKVSPTLDTIKRLADALEVPESAFHDEEINLRSLVENMVRGLPDELVNWIKMRPNTPWLVLAKDLQESEVNPEVIRDLVETWRKSIDKHTRK